MVALDPLLQVLGDVMERIARQEPLFPGCCNGRRVGSGPIRADPIGRKQGLVFQHLAEEALGRLQIALGRQEKVDRRAVLVDGPVHIAACNHRKFWLTLSGADATGGRGRGVRSREAPEKPVPAPLMVVASKPRSAT